MPKIFARPNVPTLLLSAGPRAGKTAHLQVWFQEVHTPAQYVCLTPEDGATDFFLHRFFRACPAVKKRYAALSRTLPDSSLGARLGLAIAETHPEFHLFLDDFHRIEGTPSEEHFLALFRHFPPAGKLVIASRHQLPAIERDSALTWEIAHGAWQEHPELSDLLALPAALHAKALALHMVGEGDASPEGWELVRRNLAETTPDSRHQLRSNWRDAAEQALTHTLPEGVWDHVAEDLSQRCERHQLTSREQEIARILERIPAKIRQQQPLLLQVEGDLLLEAMHYREADACFAQALALSPRPETELDCRIRQLEAAIRLKESPTLSTLLESLQSPIWTPSLRQAARITFLQGLAHRRAGENEEAKAAWERVLVIPASGDRVVCYQQYRAMLSIFSHHLSRRDFTLAKGVAERMIELASTRGLQCLLLGSFSNRILCEIADDSRPVPLQRFLEIPNDAFRFSNVSSLYTFLYQLCVRFNQGPDHALSLRLNALTGQKFRASNIDFFVQLNDIWRMILLGRLGSMDKAEALYHSLLSASSHQIRQSVPLAWTHALIQAGRDQEAEAVLQRHLEDLTDSYQAHGFILASWIRHRRGERSALDEIKGILRKPEGQSFWDGEARLLQEIGLRTLPPLFHFRAFGETTLTHGGQSVTRWPRRKALSLLALLALNPEGLNSESLQNELFKDSDSHDLSNSLHAASHGLRQALKTIGAAELLEVSRGFHRLKWEEVAFCDLYEFDALYAKAQELEAEGMKDAATLFYQVAAVIPGGDPFSNVHDEIGPVRAIYRDKLRQAKAFAQNHLRNIS